MNIFRHILSAVLALMPACLMAQQKDLYVPHVGKSVRPGTEIIATESREGYECRYIEFSTERSERIRAYLLVPDHAEGRNRLPGIVMLHDHGARFDIGKEKLARPIADILPHGKEDHICRSADQWVGKNFDGVYLADSLARMGYVVMVADALYWGERSSEEAQHWSQLTYGRPEHAGKQCAAMDPKSVKAKIKELKNNVYEGQKSVYDSLYEDGVIWAEKMLRDDVASVRLLAGLPYVDKDNIGAFGFSMGAHRCWMLAAFCKEVKCGVALSWMTTLDLSERMKASDYSMAVMPMREQMDFGDIGRFLAPKPMLFLNGRSDHLFPEDKVSTAFDKLHKHYTEYEEKQGTAAGKMQHAPLQTLFFDGGHHCGKDVQTIIAEYFNRNLR